MECNPSQIITVTDTVFSARDCLGAGSSSSNTIQPENFLKKKYFHLYTINWEIFVLKIFRVKIFRVNIFS